MAAPARAADSRFTMTRWPPDRPECLLYLAGVSWHDVPGTDRRLVARLAEHLPVLWVAPPGSVLTPGRERALQVVADGIAHLRPVGPPGPERSGVRHVSALLEQLTIRAALRELGSQAIATVISSPLPRSIRWAPRPRLYYATDDFVAGAGLMGMSETLLRGAEREQLRRCDVAAAVTDELAARFRSHGRTAEVLPNGCETATYSDVETRSRPPEIYLPDPIAGVVGQLSDRLDLALLEAVADAGHSLLLVGPRLPMRDPARWDRLLARPSVQWTGPRPYAELPAYLGAMKVGLTPYADTPFNRASFPLKTLEYLAAGLHVVSTGLPAARALGTRLVVTADNPGEYEELVAKGLVGPDDAGERARRRAAAEPHDWHHRATDVLRMLGAADRALGQ
jgi:teichuronic acid biosynthesis glycosyltransferase TuaH